MKKKCVEDGSSERGTLIIHINTLYIKIKDMVHIKRYARFYFVSRQKSESRQTFSPKISVCAAAAAAARALRAAGLGTVAIEGPRRGGDGRTN